MITIEEATFSDIFYERYTQIHSEIPDSVVVFSHFLQTLSHQWWNARMTDICHSVKQSRTYKGKNAGNYGDGNPKSSAVFNKLKIKPRFEEKLRYDKIGPCINL